MRQKPEYMQERSRVKTDRLVTREEIEKVNQLAEYEAKHGIDQWKVPSKENKIAMINAYLFDTDLVPMYRQCFNYNSDGLKATGTIKGIKEKIEVEYHYTTENHGYFTIKINDKYILNEKRTKLRERFLGQKEVVEILKDYIETKRNY